MKDTKEKETKRFRLQSILKLHNRIMDDRLKEITIPSVKNLELYREDVKKSKDPLAQALYGVLANILEHIAILGALNFEIIKQSKELTLSSSQEELASLFDLVTKNPYKHKEDIKKEAKAKTESSPVSKEELKEILEILTQIANKI